MVHLKEILKKKKDNKMEESRYTERPREREQS